MCTIYARTRAPRTANDRFWYCLHVIYFLVARKKYLLGERKILKSQSVSIVTEGVRHNNIVRHVSHHIILYTHSIVRLYIYIIISTVTDLYWRMLSSISVRVLRRRRKVQFLSFSRTPGGRKPNWFSQRAQRISRRRRFRRRLRETKK